jgi:hypothetical protein
MAGEAVTAHRETLGDRFGRWVGRHRLLAAASVALLAAGTTALIFGLLMLRRS